MSADSATTSESSRPGKGVVARRALRDSVYEVLLEQVLDGSSPPGSSLNIDSLARQLGVSPTPVREALAQMEHTGLISREALKGYRVADPLSDEQMRELVDARTVVELAAVEKAMARRAELLPELRVAHAHHLLSAHRVTQLRRGDAPPPGYADLREYFTADWNFHLAIMRAADNRYLLQMAESLSAHVHRLRQSMDHGEFDVDQAVAEHATILAAFESGDERAPVEAMRAHLAGVAERSAGAEHPGE
ncbi:GntR family transcriptional regulator [Amycolatopsis albispora]|uniref:GntR family transcriptional regulator n=1 Tax=Amycolatopsis albispora TaxID=1804986 RepID=A0A344KZE2_9PSEU|nr:GntR family transcriptional regulator [Amycolatopsis albispora]AXB41166.1 GntR family transcriptional regulator [Amycolatopsis albispora]